MGGAEGDIRVVSSPGTGRRRLQRMIVHSAFLGVHLLAHIFLRSLVLLLEYQSQYPPANLQGLSVRHQVLYVGCTPVRDSALIP